MANIVSGKTYLSPKMREMREKGLASLSYFNDEILRYAYPPYNMNAPMHREMDAWLQETFSQPKQISLMLDFRGCGKSLKGGVGHTLWRCVRNPNITIRYMHADEGMATEIMSQIRGHLEGNEIFRTLYRDEITPKSSLGLKPSDDSFTLNRTFAPRTPTLKMLGYRTAKIGTHVDLFVLDDLVNEKTTASPLLIESVKNFLRQLPPLLNDPVRSRILAVGTRWDPQDAYGTMLGEHEDDAYEDCVRSWVKSCYADTEETVSRWPDKFTVELLRRTERTRTTYYFSANMRNEPIPRGSQLFDVTKVKRYNLELDDRMRPVLPEGQPYNIYTAVDPNRKDDGTGDPAAVLTVARDPEGNHFVLDLEYGKPSSVELVLWIRQSWQKWKACAVLYEAICGQEMLLPWLRRDMLESGVAYPLVESNRKNTATTKAMRIRALSGLIESGKLWVPNSVRFKPLMREIELYTGHAKAPKDDCLDCLADIYGDGYDAAGKKGKPRREIDLPWQSSTVDAMLGLGMRGYGVRSIESGSHRFRGGVNVTVS